MDQESYSTMLEDSYRGCWNEYSDGLNALGVEKRIRYLDPTTINWDARCARAGIGVLGVNYVIHEESGEVDTVIQYEFQWRFGSEAGERRWAKSVITHHGHGSEGLSGAAACMVAYHATQQQRKLLENRE